MKTIPQTIINEYESIVESSKDEHILRILELEDLYGKENLSSGLMKLYIAKVREPYAGGMCLIAARNIHEARKVLNKDKYNSFRYDNTSLYELEDAYIKRSWRDADIIDKDSYFE